MSPGTAPRARPSSSAYRSAPARRDSWSDCMRTSSHVVRRSRRACGGSRSTGRTITLGDTDGRNRGRLSGCGSVQLSSDLGDALQGVLRPGCDGGQVASAWCHGCGIGDDVLGRIRSVRADPQMRLTRMRTAMQAVAHGRPPASAYAARHAGPASRSVMAPNRNRSDCAAFTAASSPPNLRSRSA